MSNQPLEKACTSLISDVTVRYLFGVELKGGAKELVPVEAVPSSVHKATSRTVPKRQCVEYQDRDIFWQDIGEVHWNSAPVVTLIYLLRHSTTFLKDNFVQRAAPRLRSTENRLLQSLLSVDTGGGQRPDCSTRRASPETFERTALPPIPLQGRQPKGNVLMFAHVGMRDG